MTPGDFFASFVDGNLDDYMTEPGDIRRAFNAAVAASHFADHYYNFSKRNLPKVISEFPELNDFLFYLSSATEGASKDIRSIANVYKHLYERQGPSAAYSTVSSAGSIERIDLAENKELSSIEEGWVNDDPVTGTRSFVKFTRKDGSDSEFLPILKQLIDHYRNNLL